MNFLCIIFILFTYSRCITNWIVFNFRIAFFLIFINNINRSGVYNMRSINRFILIDDICCKCTAVMSN